MANGKIELKVSSEDSKVAYVSLPDHPSGIISGMVKKTLRLRDLIEDYKGPDLYFDFDHENRLIGIEILDQ
jgi:hypothetical protein